MYIELHTRSAFSFLEGASVPEELAEVCHSHQMPAMALLDRDGVYGAARFHLAMKKLGRQAHIGAEITSLLPHVTLSDNVGTSARVPAVRFARGISEPLPAGDAHEAARAEISGSPCHARQSVKSTKSCCSARRPLLPPTISPSFLPD